MKGKATILLTNAKTGGVVKKLSEHNMMTNALKYILNPPSYSIFNNFDANYYYSKILPLYKEMLSGIVLLGNTVTENADNILLPKDAVGIGSAGSVYTGSHAGRGTLNESESYLTENGARFTWDFAADKANGTIKCIALTSRLFGDTGFRDGTTADGGLLTCDLNYPTISPNRTPTAYFDAEPGFYIGTFSPTVHTYMESAKVTNPTTLTFKQYQGLNPQGIKLQDTQTVFETQSSEPIFEKTVTLPYSVRRACNYFLNQDEKVIYFFRPPHESGTNYSKFYYFGISMESFEITKSGEITTNVRLAAGSTYSPLAAIANNKVYCYLSNNGEFGEFSMAGELLRTHSFPCVASARFTMINGCLYGITNTVIMRFGEGGSCAFNNDGIALRIGTNVDFNAPMLAASRKIVQLYNPTVDTAAVCLFNGYLATINNLSSPITKTEENALKVVYEISN